MSWEKAIEELRRRERLAERMGGEEPVERQRGRGKLTVRERVAFLADPGSFHEIGKIAGKAIYGADDELAAFTPSTSVTGRARLEGRPVVILADDFTVRGGASDASIWQKMVQMIKMATEYRMPLVQMIDGTGGGGSVKSLEKDPRTYIPETPGWSEIVQGLSQVPFVSLALGPCAGMGAGRVAASHFSVMVKELSQVFVAGPPVAIALGENVTKEELGGWKIQAQNGTVDNVVDTEADAFAAARRFLSYLPSSVHQIPDRLAPSDDPKRREESLLSIVPRDGRTPYKPRRIIEAAVDQGSFFEIGHDWGRGIVTGFARIDGYAVGILAGDPFFLDGAWTADVCDKVTRHMDLCSTFHLPVVHFVDCPGFAVGVKAEMAGVTRAGVRAMTAVYQTDVPVCSVVIRKAYGLAGSVMMNQSKTKWRYCWPSGDWGSLPMAGGIEAAFRKELSEAENPEELKAQLYKKFEAIRSPFRTAESFLAEEIIDPRDTRALLVDYVHHAQRVLAPGERRVTFRP
ncbi:MAG: methylmalonyl-CoA carboxyltransferase [Hyphomonas sp.]|uniref:acyl-CoA carboxylase subunit beta n=1 Tax=Hyphomonas sp. TaxID=87 RepID=UPI00183860F1|nr:carboxyl transferase domain-containing protein [Hyphomonas sp.]MBA3068566.1 methylmalonyl-CoA carboxyltransferase [Hyphomonas sp.]MBU4061885.1 methylmalonyl-CoA carboxyltransferase [Alphaproteobacteria bacterium]MBU4166040.1 methylmalonyl-CoA carboxyltransferase [Alphaproteobacteria bacterium]MBU4567674.1 methylmalonyl-CoA carboxyltransferase [Alphaproteobacteria bacterium]